MARFYHIAAAAALSLPVLVRAGVVARQIPAPDIAILSPACAAACQPTIDRDSACVTDAACRCSPEVFNSYGLCMTCIYDESPSSYSVTPEDFMLQYSKDCTNNGYPITFTGSSATSSASVSATASVTSASASVSATPSVSVTRSVPTSGSPPTSRPATGSSNIVSRTATSDTVGATSTPSSGATTTTWSMLGVVVAGVFGVAAFL